MHAQPSSCDHRRRLSMESRSGKPCMICLTPWAPGHHPSPTSIASSDTCSSTISVRVLPFSISKQLPTSRFSPGGAHDRWNSTSANDGRSGSLGKASEVDFELTQHIVTSYKSDRASDFPLPLSGLDPSMLLTFPRKTDSIYLRRRMAEVRNFDIVYEEKTLGSSYSRITKQSSLSLTIRRHGRMLTTVSDQCPIVMIRIRYAPQR
jgi:hypothetical protein